MRKQLYNVLGLEDHDNNLVVAVALYMHEGYVSCIIFELKLFRGSKWSTAGGRGNTKCFIVSMLTRGGAKQKKNQLRQSIHAKRNSRGCCANLNVSMSHVTFTGSMYVGLFNLTIIDQNLSMFEQWLFGAWETLFHSFIPNKAVISAELCPLFSSCASAPCITSLFSLYLFYQPQLLSIYIMERFKEVISMMNNKMTY